MSASARTGTRLTSLAKHRAEDLLDDRAAGAGRVLADLLLLVCDRHVQAVERLRGDVTVKVGGLLADEAGAGRLVGELLVFLGELHLVRRLVHDRQEALV